MLISVVTGSYQRLGSLIRMVESVRRCIAPSIEYEIIVVDGGSTDGTQSWCKSNNVRLIEHNELKGALRAFTDGAYAATGEYVLLANDDIEFLPGSIMGALSYIESHAKCGAVAFLDNRQTPGRTPGAFAAQTMQAVAPDGKSVRVLYAQVGLVRRALGNTAGWWGADDPGMASRARTYGGDNYLSAKLWEMGYTVDVARGAMCRDHLYVDDLRRNNTANNDQGFYSVFPKGPYINSKPHNGVEYAERLRILYLPVYEPTYDLHKSTKRGLRDALQRRGIVWEWDYLDDKRPGIAEDFQLFKPHLILTQFMDGKRTELIDQLRALCPQSLIVNWNGDARGLVTPDMLAMLRKVDLQLVVNAAALPVYEANDIRAAYWQIGYEPRGAKQEGVARDIVFLGNRYNEAREALERALDGLPVTYFGRGWRKSEGDTTYDFDRGDAIYKNAKIAISDAFTDGKTETYGFVSNRFFEALASGAFLLQQRVDGLDKLNGVCAGQHYIEWTDYDDLRKQIARWLDTPGAERERAAIASAGQGFVLRNFSFDRQVDRLFGEILPMLEAQYVTA